MHELAIADAVLSMALESKPDLIVRLATNFRWAFPFFMVIRA